MREKKLCLTNKDGSGTVRWYGMVRLSFSQDVRYAFFVVVRVRYAFFVLVRVRYIGTLFEFANFYAQNTFKKIARENAH